MTAKLTHGMRLVKALTDALPPNLKWTAEEQIVLDQVEQVGDRLEVLRARFAVAAKDPDITVNQIAVLSAEIRLSEEAVGRWSRSLNSEGEPPQAVSRPHQRAALTRWHGHGANA